MRYYFDDPERQKELKAVLESWLGTPFRHAAMVKKAGVDCIHFVKGALDETGVRTPKVPKYPKDWHIHQTENLMINGLNGAGCFELQPDVNPKNGDIIVFHYGKVESHVAIFFEGNLYHALSGASVVKSDYKEQFLRSKVRKVYRVKA